MGKSRVFFPSPIISEVLAPRPPGRPHTLAYQEIQNLTRTLREAGWDLRSVVTKYVKFAHTGMPNNYEMARPVTWGVIIDVRNVVGFSGTQYFPFKVQWVTDGSISEHWPEELVLIHKAINQPVVDTAVKERSYGGA